MQASGGGNLEAVKVRVRVDIVMFLGSSHLLLSVSKGYSNILYIQ